MPKNKGKGGKNRRRGKNENVVKRDLIEKGEGQEYAQVIRMLGNGRLEAYCFDGKKRLCHIRGKMRKKVWVNQSDIVLVGLRPYQDDKGDIILRYNTEEARTLKKRGELPSNIQIEDHPELDAEDNVPFEFTADKNSDDNDSSDGEMVSAQPANRGILPPVMSESNEDIDFDAL